MNVASNCEAKSEVGGGGGGQPAHASINHSPAESGKPGKFIRGGFMWRRQFDKNPYEVRPRQRLAEINENYLLYTGESKRARGGMKGRAAGMMNRRGG